MYEIHKDGNQIKCKPNLPRKVALGELYAKYSLFDAHAGNSFCCNPSVSSSFRFQGSWVSIAVGVVTRVSPKKLHTYKHKNQFNHIIGAVEIGSSIFIEL